MCYEKCPKYYYYDSNNTYQCADVCPTEYNKFIQAKNRCIDDCKKDNKYKYESLQRICR